MNLKQSLFFLFLLVGITQISLAQRSSNEMRMTPEQRVEMSNIKMDSVVSLSSDQKTAVNFLHEELFLKDVLERGSIRNMTEQQREDFRTQRQVKMRAYQEGLGAVLTKEQLEKWKTFEEARNGQRRQRGDSNRARRPRGQ